MKTETRPTVYVTEAELLSTTPGYGSEAVALDTGYAGTYYGAIGWVQTNRPGDERLIPENPTAGYVVSSADGESPAWERPRAWKTTSVSRTSVITGTSKTSMFDDRIVLPAGTLSHDGDYVHITVIGSLLNNHSSSDTVDIGLALYDISNGEVSIWQSAPSTTIPTGGSRAFHMFATLMRGASFVSLGGYAALSSLTAATAGLGALDSPLFNAPFYQQKATSTWTTALNLDDTVVRIYAQLNANNINLSFNPKVATVESFYSTEV